ncbi:MAG TPA: acylphosphatase [Trebonia sp.]
MKVGDEGEQTARLTAWVEGRVQGVGFRAWVRRRASELGLDGFATNLDDGRVEVVAEGGESRCQRLLDELEGGVGPGRVTRVTQRWGAPRGNMSGFVER